MSVPTIVKVFYTVVIISLFLIGWGVYVQDESIILSPNNCSCPAYDPNECYKILIEQNHNLRAVKEQFEMGEK